jgi:hypothetical protein
VLQFSRFFKNGRELFSVRYEYVWQLKVNGLSSIQAEHHAGRSPTVQSMHGLHHSADQRVDRGPERAQPPRRSIYRRASPGGGRRALVKHAPLATTHNAVIVIRQACAGQRSFSNSLPMESMAANVYMNTERLLHSSDAPCYKSRLLLRRWAAANAESSSTVAVRQNSVRIRIIGSHERAGGRCSSRVANSPFRQRNCAGAEHFPDVHGPLNPWPINQAAWCVVAIELHYRLPLNTNAENTLQLYITPLSWMHKKRLRNQYLEFHQHCYVQNIRSLRAHQIAK